MNLFDRRCTQQAANSFFVCLPIPKMKLAESFLWDSTRDVSFNNYHLAISEHASLTAVCTVKQHECQSMNVLTEVSIYTA